MALFLFIYFPLLYDLGVLPFLGVSLTKGFPLKTSSAVLFVPRSVLDRSKGGRFLGRKATLVFDAAGAKRGNGTAVVFQQRTGCVVASACAYMCTSPVCACFCVLSFVRLCTCPSFSPQCMERSAEAGVFPHLLSPNTYPELSRLLAKV